MSKKAPTWDVFLSFGLADKAIAAQVQRAFAAQGLSVFVPQRVKAGRDVVDDIRRSLVESRAVVFLCTRAGVESFIGVEFGASLAWVKPAYVLIEGIQQGDLPLYLRKLPTYTLEKLPDLVVEIRQSISVLSNDEIAMLTTFYEEFDTPADRLVTDPSSLDAFTSAFNKRAKLSLPGERIAQELMRLRKSGRLPRLRR